ncbi:hypothetical protein [Pseudomonas sp. RIT-PI-S]|uniref:hypothetical protein n=1 Tax=Pseudomonas sp. RIT-PI-S TaxID=3035295 RepID=UPI0021D9C3A8|nr:hypothetical protein [Pseudomonas sp. RIT-PI-S]
MRIDGVASRSYPIKRKPRTGLARVDDAVDEQEGEIEVIEARQRPAAGGGRGTLVASFSPRQQEEMFRGVNARVATALASYLTTASFVEWDGEVLGLDVHI